jgi:tRNA threonylcarbamoyladenosine biosynthesis protein TsaE
MQLNFNINTAHAMEVLGEKIARACASPLFIYLIGDLGAGKTTLVRGFLHAFGHQGLVKSPTYTLIEPYHIENKIIYHLDLYRLVTAEELEYLGIRDYFNGDAFCLVEWPERGGEFLPQADVTCSIKIQKNKRLVELHAISDQGKKLLLRMEPKK